MTRGDCKARTLDGLIAQHARASDAAAVTAALSDFEALSGDALCTSAQTVLHFWRSEFARALGDSAKQLAELESAWECVTTDLFASHEIASWASDLTQDAKWYKRALQSAIATEGLPVGDSLQRLLGQAEAGKLDGETTAILMLGIEVGLRRVEYQGPRPESIEDQVRLVIQLEADRPEHRHRDQDPRPDL